MNEDAYRIILSDRALRDFKSIQRYTKRNYGPQQVIKYSEQIKTALNKLAENPELYGHERPDIPSSHLSCRAGKNSIVFRIEGSVIYVVAILHGRMDFKATLS